MSDWRDPSLDIENANAYARQMQERAFAAEAEAERLRHRLAAFIEVLNYRSEALNYESSNVAKRDAEILRLRAIIRQANDLIARRLAERA